MPALEDDLPRCERAPVGESLAAALPSSMSTSGDKGVGLHFEVGARARRRQIGEGAVRAEAVGDVLRGQGRHRAIGPP